MLKIILKIDGMMCGMCESRINDVIRKNFAVKKVSSFHSKGKTEIITENPIPEEDLRKAIGETGYKLVGVQTEAHEKKGFSLFHK